ncbi:nucleotidyltransferase domain-containing protein [Leifsonia xyli]|uniref:nucleotidyltransferase domain-containing protein n=1 Tax=Leifsonia xyli TaxID=1575 RepID=UPI003D66B1D6
MGVPALQQEFLDDVLPRIVADSRVRAVALSGSLAHGEPDQYSDVDLVIAVPDADHGTVMAERLDLIASWTDLVIGFTGEHVGEPRLIVSLVGPPLLHVDVTFLPESAFAQARHRLRILHGEANFDSADAPRPVDPRPFDAQWAEDRFWVWIHYAATKLARGELFEVLDTLAALRSLVLGPLAALRAHAEPRGVRRLETIAPQDALALRDTVSGYDGREAGEALFATIALYRNWRPDAVRRNPAEELAEDFLCDVIAALP